MAHANPHNLSGFPDAFKAILQAYPGCTGAKALSLTPCDDFA
jgi:hypothetical protein